MGLVDEAREVVEGARRQLVSARAPLAELTPLMRVRPPQLVATIARGSSDHAATYGKYLLETASGLVVASAAPSIASIYERSLGLDRALVLAISQSGRTPDVLELARSARADGAIVVAIVNDEASPLAAIAEVVVPVCAGPERAIAATKSYLLSCLALLQIAERWSNGLGAEQAPDVLAQVTAAPLEPLAGATSMYVVGRGPGFGAAQEVALKLKETCRIHAEAFSTAEVQHGPIALVGSGFPVLAVVQDDATASTTRATLDRLRALGANVITLATGPAPAELQPLAAVLSCYLALPALARARGLDADAPPHLSKVTETL